MRCIVSSHLVLCFAHYHIASLRGTAWRRDTAPPLHHCVETTRDETTHHCTWDETRRHHTVSPHHTAPRHETRQHTTHRAANRMRQDETTSPGITATPYHDIGRHDTRPHRIRQDHARITPHHIAQTRRLDTTPHRFAHGMMR